MNKKDFLNLLEKELETKRINYKDAKNLIEFYDELIEDKIEAGQKEEQVITEIGNVSDIVKNISALEIIETAKEKPTISNGVKALFAVLGILSLPLLIPACIAAASLLFAMIITILCIIFSLALVIVSGIGVLIALVVYLINGTFPLTSFLFGIGITLVVIGVSIQLLKLSILLPKKIIVLTIRQLEKTVNRKKEKDYE